MARVDSHALRLASATLICLTACCGGLNDLSAAEPLHTRIDRLINAQHFGAASALACDAEFLRRVYLDLTGSIPTTATARAFLDDPTPEKRISLIDRLLDSPQYVRHMTNVLDIMLMERRAEKHIKSPEWQQYLHASVAQHKPYDQLVREILSADGVDANLRPAARFYLDREGETHSLTRDVGRIFFGMDLQCAQCHDHPLIDDYEQSHYYGIFAFLNRSFVFTDKEKKVFFAEKAEGEVEFKSVFTEEAGKTKPRLPGGEEIDEPHFEKGQEYDVAPADNVRPVPKFSRRAQLAREATSGLNLAFNRNIANRLWAHMMGRGLVEPVDLQHAGNPPAHAQLLDMLAQEFVALKFDVKRFLRELVQTQAYQCSVELPTKWSAATQNAREQLTALAEEHKTLVAAGKRNEQTAAEASTKLSQAQEAAAPLAEQLAGADVTLRGAQQAAETAAAKRAAAQQKLVAKQEVADAVNDAAETARLVIAKLPDEKRLAQAAKVFESRAKQLARELTATTAVVAELSASVNRTADELAAVQKTRDDVREKLAKVRQQVDACRQQLAQAQARLRGDQLADQQVSNRMADAKRLIEYEQLQASALQSHEAITKAQADWDTQRASLTALTAAMPKLRSRLAQAKTSRAAAEQAFSKLQQQLSVNQEAIQLVGEFAAKATAASRKLPDDKQLEQAAQNVTSRGDQLHAQLSQLQASVTQQAQAAETVRRRYLAAEQAMEAAHAQQAMLEQTIPALEVQLRQATETSAADLAALASAKKELTIRWTQRFFVRAITPLSPEQIGWSVMEATGVVAQQRKAAKAEAAKDVDPRKSDDPSKVDLARDGARRMEQFVFDKLKGNVGTFVKLFGHEAGQPQTDFFATVDQALFFANGGTVLGWLQPGNNNLTDRLVKQQDRQALAEELYLGVLTRRPTDQEVADVIAYLASRPNEKNKVVQELAWALLTSVEFRFHH